MSEGPVGDLWRRLTRYVDDAMARERKVPSPNENYKLWFLTVEDAAGTPVRGIGVERIVFDAGVVSKPQPGVVRVAGGGGGGGYHWGVVAADLTSTGTLAIRHPVVASRGLSTLYWTAFNGVDVTVTVYHNTTPIATHVVNANGNGAASASVAVGDYLEARITGWIAAGDLGLTWA